MEKGKDGVHTLFQFFFFSSEGQHREMTSEEEFDVRMMMMREEGGGPLRVVSGCQRCMPRSVRRRRRSVCVRERGGEIIKINKYVDTP